MIPFEKEYRNAAAIAKQSAGEKYTWYVDITAAERDEYGPFRGLIVSNNSDKAVDVVLDHDTGKPYALQPGEKMNLIGAQFSFVSIENQDTNNEIAIGEIVVRVMNTI